MFTLKFVASLLTTFTLFLSTLIVPVAAAPRQPSSPVPKATVPVSNCTPIHLSQVPSYVPSPGDGAQGWRDALDILANCKGGTLDASGTDTTIRTTVAKNYLNLATQIVIKGGQNGRVTISTGEFVDGLVFQNTQDLLIEGMTIIGGGVNGAYVADAFNAINLQNTAATLQGNLLIGLGVHARFGGTIKVGVGSSANIFRNMFRACRSHSANDAATIFAENFRSLVVLDNEFWDYGTLPNGDGSGTYYSTNGQAGLAWVKVGNQERSGLATPVVIGRNKFDEGAYRAVQVAPSIRLQSIVLHHNAMNVGTGAGYYLQNIEYADIEGGSAGLHKSPPVIDAITSLNVRYLTIRNFKPAPDTTAKRLTVDSGTVMLRVVDSPFATIVNNAQAWRIENGGQVHTSAAAVKVKRWS